MPKMRIEITKLNSKEIINILRSFPNGKLGYEKDLIYWETKDLVPTYNPESVQAVQNQVYLELPPQQGRSEKVHNPIHNMKNFLFEAFS